MLLSSYLKLALCLLGDIAIAIEQNQAVPGGLERRSVDPGTVITARIALKQRNTENGPEWLEEISDPSSPNYGRHWTSEQVHEAFAPSQESVEAATLWLVQSGFTRDSIKQSASKGYLLFDSSIAQLEGLLRARYNLYSRDEDEDHVLATERYTIPDTLRDHVDFVHPGLIDPESFRGIPKAESISLQKRQSYCPSLKANWTLYDCWQQANPECVNQLYGIPEAPPKPVKGHRSRPNRLALFQLGVTAVPSDMRKFFTEVAPDIPVNTVPENNFVNGVQITENFNASYGLAAEANLDFQIAWPLIYPYNITQLSAQPTDAEQADLVTQNGTYLELVSSLLTLSLEDAFGSIDKSFCQNKTNVYCGIYKPPSVLSISYVAWELYTEEVVAKRLCNEILKLGLQGTTVLVASGDSGTTLRNNTCYGPDNNVFVSSALAACPWVTAVGATMLPNPQDENGFTNRSLPSPDQEVAAFQPIFNYSSSGGFSTYFEQPKYQRKTVSQYLRKNPSPYKTYNYNGTVESIGANGGRYNAAGRGIPDISALGVNYTIVYDGCVQGLGGGTSAAAPLLGAVIFRINEERAKIGKAPVGFINHVLYKHPEILYDVVKGQNSGCNTDGFHAVRGWDPVTGLGTPNYEKMLELFLCLP